MERSILRGLLYFVGTLSAVASPMQAGVDAYVSQITAVLCLGFLAVSAVHQTEAEREEARVADKAGREAHARERARLRLTD